MDKDFCPAMHLNTIMINNFVPYSADSDKTPSTTCPFPCLNGGSCVDNKCVCKAGFTGDYCSERKLEIFRTI